MKPKSRQIVWIPDTTYDRARPIVIQIFNAAELWANPVSESGIVRLIKENKHNTICVFNENELRLFGKRSYVGWAGKEFKYGNLRIIVFPDIDKKTDPIKFEYTLRLARQVDTSKLDVRIITSDLVYKEAIAYVRKIPYVVFDFETKHKDPYQIDAKILSLAFGNKERAYVLPCFHRERSTGNVFSVMNRLNGIMKLICTEKELIGHNIKYEFRWMLKYGYAIKDCFMDTMVIHHLLDETAPHGLDWLAAQYTQYGGYELDLAEKLEDKNDYESAPLEDLCRYNGLDVIMTDLVAVELYRLLEDEEKIKKLWQKLIRPSITMLAKMEDAGFSVDEKKLYELQKHYIDRRDVLEVEMKKLPKLSKFFALRPDFNFNSTPQLAFLLYDYLKLPILRRTKASKKFTRGSPSTDDKTLIQLRERNQHVNLIDLLRLRHKANTMNKNFFVPFSAKLNITVDRVMRTNFNLHVVETGRLSSSSPNLQNIATDAMLESRGFPPIKPMFVSRFKGGSLIQVDLKQAELRTAAMYTVAYGKPDKTLMRAFVEGRDLHGEMAEHVYGKGYTKHQRDLAKRTNFSAVFDISPERLALNLNCTVDEAKKLIRIFRHLHPELYEMFDFWWKNAQMDGYIENFNGRKRHITYELSKAVTPYEFGDVERQVWNFPIQSTAAELTLTGGLFVWRQLNDRKMAAKKIGNVHDSIIIDSPADEFDDVLTIIKQQYKRLNEYYKWITVPVEIDITFGETLSGGVVVET